MLQYSPADPSDTWVPESPLQLEAVLFSLFVWFPLLVDWELTELFDVSYVSLELRPTIDSVKGCFESFFLLFEAPLDMFKSSVLRFLKWGVTSL